MYPEGGEEALEAGGPRHHEGGLPGPADRPDWGEDQGAAGQEETLRGLHTLGCVAEV